MHQEPFVSIIIPTYNRSYIIRGAIESIVRQTNPRWELIVVDDGSTDNTEQVVASFGDNRIRYVRQENQRVARARNHGVSLARAKWVAYLDSDNELFPEYVDTMLRWLEKSPRAVFAIPRAKRTLELVENGVVVKSVDDSKDTPPGVTLQDIFYKKLHFDTNGLIHLRSLFDESIAWDPAFKAMEDWDLAMCIGEKHPDGFLYVEEVLYHYRQRYGGDGLVSNNGYKDWADTFEQVYQKHKHDSLLQGQTWYPERVEKWNRLQKEFEEGKLPPYNRYYFQ